jgi:hypothetical protein
MLTKTVFDWTVPQYGGYGFTIMASLLEMSDKIYSVIPLDVSGDGMQNLFSK